MNATTYYEETREDGSVIRTPGTRWRAMGDVRLDLTPSANWSVEAQRFTNLEGDASKGTIRVKPWIVELKAGEEIVLDRNLDFLLEMRHCREPVCRPGGLRCRNWSHRSDIVGGLGGGRIVRVGGTASPARMHPSIDPGSPAAVARPVVVDDADADARLMARAQAARAARGGAA